jgi:hypothetical protein
VDDDLILLEDNNAEGYAAYLFKEEPHYILLESSEGPVAKTRAQLVQEVADAYGEYFTNTADSGSTTTIVDTENIEADDFWNNHFAHVITDAGGASAAPEGEERPVSDFVQSTGTVTVSPAFSAAVAAGDTYEILPERRAVIERAINAAIREAGTRWWVPSTDTSTITLAANTYSYSLPTDVVYIVDILYRSASDDPWESIETSNWYVAGAPGAQTLYLYDIGDYDTGDVLRVDYQVRLSELSADASTLDIGAPGETELVQFIVDYALYWLHNRAANANPVGGEVRLHLTQAKDYLDKAMYKLNRAPRWGQGGRIHQGRKQDIRG